MRPQYMRIVRDQIYPDLPFIEFLDMQTGVTFMLPVVRGETQAALMVRLCALLRVHEASLSYKTRR